MIRIDRGDEPPALQKDRVWRLARATLVHLDSGAPPPPELLTGYDAARDGLYEAQGRKCAWCERPIGRAGSPLEHFRPRAGAQRNPGDPPSRWDRDRYWWLTWTWENLLLSCSSCNSPAHKGNYFPIATPPLPLRSFDVEQETALLVDPAGEDPLDHLQWRPIHPHLPRTEWTWTPYPVGRKGGPSLRIVLGRSGGAPGGPIADLIVQVTRHVQSVVLPVVEQIEALLTNHSNEQADAAWAELGRRHLAREAPYAAAVWCALRFMQDQPDSPLRRVPPPSRPGAAGPRTRPPALPAAPQGVPHRAWLALLAGERIEEALLEILKAGPRTKAELVGLVQPVEGARTREAGISTALRTLTEAGQLRLNRRTYHAA